MNIILAEAMGMCFGVRDALAITERLDDPSEVTIHGELVHNGSVNRRLTAKGFQITQEEDRSPVPQTPVVLLTAHGVSRTEKERLRRAGKRLVDTTCPLVARVHEAADRLDAQGCHVLVIGRRGHVEVEGIVGDLESFDVLESAREVETYPQKKLGVISQTTTPLSDVERIYRTVQRRNPQAEIRFVDTVCQPTKDRQRALDDLLDQVNVVVVVGGKNSNNTRQLAGRCRHRGVPAYHVQGPSELRVDWFDRRSVVGLTAGTSTLDQTIQSVERRLLEIAAGVHRGSPATDSRSTAS